MADQTGIEWADSTFNPWMGCTKVSPACDHCYAERDTARFGRVEWGAGKPRIRTSEANWRKPLQWNRAMFHECVACGWRGEDGALAEPRRVCPACSGNTFEAARRRVFCASLADVFDNEAPIEWLADLLDLIRRTPNLDWLLLTKRIGNWHTRLTAAHQHVIKEMGGGGAEQSEHPLWPLGLWIQGWLAGKAPANVWLGATICNQAEADRDIPKLLATEAAVRFLSIEPMLGPVNASKYMWPVHGWWTGPHNSYRDAKAAGAECGLRRQALVLADALFVDWVICGGESGPRARPMHPAWVRSLRDQCAAAGVAFLFKQWGEWVSVSEVEGEGPHHSFEDGATVRRVGKKVAGRQIDGKTHTGFPESAS